MGDSYKAFEDWVNGMMEDEYGEWLQNDATDKQAEKALNIREPPDKQDDVIIEDEQTYVPEQEQEPQAPKIYNEQEERILPSVTYDEHVITPSQAPIRIRSRSPITFEPIESTEETQREVIDNMPIENPIKQIKNQLYHPKIPKTPMYPFRLEDYRKPMKVTNVRNRVSKPRTSFRQRLSNVGSRIRGFFRRDK